MSGVVAKHGFLPPPPKRNLFATVVGSVLGQRVRFARARMLRGKLYTQLGTDDFCPQQIRALGVDGLRALGVGKKRSETVVRLANFVVDGDLRLSTAADARALTQVEGVGEWTVRCAALVHSLHDDDANFDDTLLVSDLIIRRGIKSLYGVTAKKEIAALAQTWSPWRGVVTWYLWKEFT